MARNTRKNMFNVEISVGRKNCEPDYCTCTSTVSSSGMTMIADGAPRCRRPALVCMSTTTTERAASRDVSLSAVTMTGSTTKQPCFEIGCQRARRKRSNWSERRRKRWPVTVNAARSAFDRSWVVRTLMPAYCRRRGITAGREAVV